MRSQREVVERPVTERPALPGGSVGAGTGSTTSGPNIPICTCSVVLTWQW